MMKKSSKDKELEDIKNRLMRTLADYSNLQKRVAEERKNLIKFANTTLLVKFIAILDSLEKTAESVKDEGLNLSIKNFKNILELEGVTEIESEGKGFDPRFHEAIEIVNGKEDDKVVEVLEKGYMLGDKVLLPVRVNVSKKQVDSREN